MPTLDEAISFYETRYDMLGSWLVQPGQKITLGDKSKRVCRFCGKQAPEVTFKKTAHAIPESLGNKSIDTFYECDRCNGFFGSTIEDDLGKWSKPTRTMARIRGKSGVPTLKRGGDTGWRIEYKDSGFLITAYEDDPLFNVDEASKTVTFDLKREPYTPVAVLKAFVKIGLTLIPDNEMPNFKRALAWICDRDHSRAFVNKLPVFYTFQPGPMPNTLLAAFILRRKPSVKKVPYAFLVLGYGNEVFQVILPSNEQDAALNEKTLNFIPFPNPGSSDPNRFPKAGRAVLDLSGRDEIKNEKCPVTMDFDYIIISQ